MHTYRKLINEALAERRHALRDTADANLFAERGLEDEALTSEAWARAHWRQAHMHLARARRVRTAYGTGAALSRALGRVA